MIFLNIKKIKNTLLQTFFVSCCNHVVAAADFFCESLSLCIILANVLLCIDGFEHFGRHLWTDFCHCCNVTTVQDVLMKPCRCGTDIT